MAKLLIISFLALAIGAPSAFAAKAAALPQVAVSDNDDAIGREYIAGGFAARNNDYEAAAKLFEEALLKNPNDAFLLQNTYRSMLMAGNYESAAKYAQKYLEYDKKSINAAFLLAVYKASKGDFSGSYATLDAVPNDNNTKTMGIEQLLLPFVRAWVVAGEGNYDSAIAALDPHDIGTIVSKTFVSLQKALLYSLSGNNELADQTFGELTAEKGVMPYHLTKAAASFYESIGKWDDAARVYAKYREGHTSTTHFESADDKIRNKTSDGLYIKNPKQGLAEVMKEAARLLFASGVYNEGLVYLRLALMLKPHDDEANILLASHFDEHKDWQKAIAIYDKITATSDFYLDAQINKAEDLYSSDKKAGAKKLLLDVAKNAKEKYIPLITLADLLRKNTEYKQAAEIYTEVLKNINPNSKVSWAVYFGRGMCLERTGKLKQSEADFLKALELSPNQPEVMNYLAYSWVDHNENLEKATEMLLKAAARRPEDPQILDSAGWALYKMKDYENAVLFLEKATMLSPQDAVMNDHLGDIYWMMGRKYEAVYAWQRAVKYGPAESSTVAQLERKIAKGL